MNSLQSTIETAFDERRALDLSNPAPELRDAVLTAIDRLDAGQVRVAEKVDGQWVVNQWLKAARVPLSSKKYISDVCAVSQHLVDRASGKPRFSCSVLNAFLLQFLDD